MKRRLVKEYRRKHSKERDENKPHYFVKLRFTSISVQTDTNNAMADPVLGHMVLDKSPENFYNTELQKNLAPDV